MTWLARAWAHLRDERYGSYIWTARGERFWPLDPRPEDILIEDIARGLATGCRYSGQIGIGTGYVFYSVAEHSVIVSIYAEKRARELGLGAAIARTWALEGLLHDASEAYIGDVSRPVKYSQVMRGYRAVERRLEAVIAERFDLRPTAQCKREIKSIDKRILVDEIDAFMILPDGDSIEREVEKHGQPLGATITGLPPAHAEYIFLQRYRALTKGKSA